MTKLQVHTATDEAPFQHGASPGRTRNGHPDWFWAVLGMSRDKRVVVAQKNDLVTVVLGLNLQHRRGGQVIEEHAPFNFRLHNIAIHFIAEVGMGAE
jgi:hypothetical protein